MPKNNISQYDASASSNTDVGGIDIDEGMAPSNVNNAIREVMSHLKDMDVGTSALTSPDFTAFKVGGASITSTAAELNILDGDTSATSTVIADADRIILNDDGTLVQVAVTDLASYIGGGSSGGISNVVEDTTPQLGGDLDGQTYNITTTGKILFANMYANESDLPSATTYHGMFAHVHATGAGYFAHAGAWVKLANNSQLSSYATTSQIANSSNWDTAYGWGDHSSAGYLTSAPAPTSAQVGSATSGLSAGDVGSYAMLEPTASLSSSSTGLPGATRAGSGLKYSDTNGTDGSNPSGTWQCMGNVNSLHRSVWLRIS